MLDMEPSKELILSLGRLGRPVLHTRMPGRGSSQPRSAGGVFLTHGNTRSICSHVRTKFRRMCYFEWQCDGSLSPKRPMRSKGRARDASWRQAWGERKQHHQQQQRRCGCRVPPSHFWAWRRVTQSCGRPCTPATACRLSYNICFSIYCRRQGKLTFFHHVNYMDFVERI